MSSTKKVLLINASPMMREFLREKINAEHIIVDTVKGQNEAFSKMQNSLPDLIILDLPEGFEEFIEFLENKYNDSNCRNIPVIISGPVLTKERIEHLQKFGVVNYFPKPVKFDILLEGIGKVLKCTFSIDVTQCILNVHLKGNIIFIEIAEGMNREKLSLLKYRISEIIERSKLTEPNIVLMISNMDFCFVDAPNLEMLLDSVTADERVQKKNVKVLSKESFVKELVQGHPEYSGIEVVDDIKSILSSLIVPDRNEEVSQQISEKILETDHYADEASLSMKFISDSGIIRNEKTNEDQPLTIAVVDDDIVVRKILESAIKSIGAQAVLFVSGAEFIQKAAREHFDLVILDIYMPGLSGFDILKNLQDKEYPAPIIIYSQVMQKENIVQALSLGAKAYLVKPQTPAVIIQKIKELLA